MIILKILGIVDLFIGIIFWLFGIFSLHSWSSFIFLIGLYLLAKGIVFATQLSIASILDIISALLIIYASSNEIYSLLIIIISIFLVQKGIFSMLG